MLSKHQYDIASLMFLDYLRIDNRTEQQEKTYQELLKSITDYERHEYPEHFRNAERHHRKGKLRTILYLAKHKCRMLSYM